MSQSIQIYARIRPSKKSSGYWNIVSPDDEDSGGKGRANQLQFNVPIEDVPGAPSSVTVNNTRTTHRFKFNDVLPMDITQEEVRALPSMRSGCINPRLRASCAVSRVPIVCSLCGDLADTATASRMEALLYRPMR